MRRLRLLVYDGDDKWNAFMKSKDVCSPFHAGGGTIESFDLDMTDPAVIQVEMEARMAKEESSGR